MDAQTSQIRLDHRKHSNVLLNHREIKVRDRITSFPPCTTMSQKIDKEIRISLSMSSMFYPQSL